MIRGLTWGGALACAVFVASCAKTTTGAGAAGGERAGTGPVLGPEIDFSEQPAYVPNDTLSLTFDDGPLSPFTGQVLDILKANGAHATFFINTDNNGSNVDGNPAHQELIRRMVSEGHGLGNHTTHHTSLKTLPPEQIETEIRGVEETVKSLFPASPPRLSLLRSPYGEPYQDYYYDPKDPLGATYPMVAAVVSKHAIHVGWNVETDDWKCTTGNPEANTKCVYDNFTSAVKTIGAPEAKWGIVLMHCVNPQTPAALPRILEYVRANHFKLVSVEDVVRARFGKSSADVLDGK
jgi:peptidoglycan/xylan/chitin deacetylase (PgdA/CDA1 family)